jgi:tetratricopeptide (TPR) repeat protein
MKALYCSALCVLLLNSAIAQNQFDRNKVLDYFQGQQFEDAIGYLLPLSAHDSTNIQLLGYLAYCYNMLDDVKSAARYYTKIILIDSTNISANQNLAAIHSNKNPEIAEMITWRLMRLQPGKAMHYRNMGDLLVGSNLRDSAVLFYEKAYALSPGDPKNVAALTEVLLDLKDYPTADSILATGLEKDSMNVAYLILKIRSAFETENYENTLDPGEKLMQQQEIPLKSLLQVVVSYYNLNQYHHCIRICDYLRSNEIEGEAMNYYEAKAWSKLKDFDKSNELLQACIKSALSEKAEMYYYALADNYEEVGKYKTAIAHYDTAYYLFRDPLMKYNIGRIYETKLKNSEVAGKYFKRYLMYADTSTPDKKKVYHYLNKRYSTKK